ncbi:TlpA family protein disulfide reductase [Pedobacter metabolipauper]|uniref:AhpC/TSA family protein n=1 Tax=Pedobacter metabolipauper TaxID=425513 RepID=A0A4R6ST12_9SPHI|nr:TlpA disulfide reductase family protein [Pedobacter metabolipauper]TDQ07005.1 AhpC/TSA family protein [Pedobacter metabolipauper]
MIKLAPILLLIALFTLANNLATAQEQKGILVKGHVDYQASKTLRIKSGNELEWISSKVSLSKSGDFRFYIPKRSSTEYLSINDGKGVEVGLYTNFSDSVELSWSDKDPFGTLKIKLNDTPEPQFVKWLGSMNQLRGPKKAALDSCKSLADYCTRLWHFQDQEIALLKGALSKKESWFYDKYATDIFYKNMDLLISSPFYKDLNFSSPTGSFVFPGIALKSRQFDKEVDSVYQFRKIKYPQVDTLTSYKMASSQAENKFKSRYCVIDPIAFKSSHSYRIFIKEYFQKIMLEVYYRKLSNDIIFNVSAYSDLMKHLISDPAIHNWLVASQVESKITTSQFRKPGEFLEDLKSVNDSLLKSELNFYLASMKKYTPGTPAPDFIFVNEKNQKVSLSSYKGKYVYVNFWDSGCGPCIDDIMRNSKDVSGKYAGRDVVFLYISLDRESTGWKKTLKRVNPIGINGRIEIGWAGKPVIDYSINAVPRHLIIDPDGNLIDDHADDLYSLKGADPFKSK